MSASCQIYKLEPNSELRIEFSPNLMNKNFIELVDGNAEIYGNELVAGKKYHMSSSDKIAIFSWFGGEIAINGSTQSAYLSNDTPMTFYLNIHGALQQIIDRNKSENGRGPRVLICGPLDSGKTTLCKILCNYYIRRKMKPMFVDLDQKLGLIGLPNTIGAAVIEKPIDIESNFLEENSMSPPLVYFTGISEDTDGKWLGKVFESLIDTINIKFENNAECNTCGMIVNSPGCVTIKDIQNLMQVIKSMEIDTILVLNSERILNQLSKELNETNIAAKIFNVPKSGGVVERSRKERSELKDLRIHQYFYGPLNNWVPYSFDLKTYKINLYQVILKQIDSSLLPIGSEMVQDKFYALEKVTIDESLQNNLVGLCFYDSNSATESEVDASNENIPKIEEIAYKNLAGFLLINEVDVSKKTVKVLSPIAPPLLFSNWILVNVQYVEILK